MGIKTINAAIRTVDSTGRLQVRDLAEVYSRFLPSVSLSDRNLFREALVHLARIKESDLAGEESLYLTSRQLHGLTAVDCEIGNHTYSHVNCRCLTQEELVREIDANRAVLETISGSKVRSFSVPYGSSMDLTPTVMSHLQRNGYEASFLSMSVPNPLNGNRLSLSRVSIKGGSDPTIFSQIEILPRLRGIRDSRKRRPNAISTSTAVDIT